MNRHYILDLNPQANHEWDRCVLRNPITGERPDLNFAIAEAVKNQPGSYLIKVSINVEILEQTLPNTRELKQETNEDKEPNFYLDRKIVPQVCNAQ